MCMSGCDLVHLSAAAPGGQKKALNLLELIYRQRSVDRRGYWKLNLDTLQIP